MTPQDTMRLALEALEAGDWYIGQLELVVYAVDDDGVHENRAKVKSAIEALREALAQQVAKPNCDECAKWVVQQADNREWIEGVAEGRRIVEAIVAKELQCRSS